MLIQNRSTNSWLILTWKPGYKFFDLTFFNLQVFSFYFTKLDVVSVGIGNKFMFLIDFKNLIIKRTKI